MSLVKHIVRVTSGALACICFLAAWIPVQVETAGPEFESFAVRSGEIGNSNIKSTPKILKISGINLNAVITPVGVDKDNAFDVPSSDLVGWYQYGSSPGSFGSTVLAAHVDYAGVEGIFFNLQKVKVGQTITIETELGYTEYKVSAVKSYEKTGLPINELFTKSGPEKLQLITCDGEFDKIDRSYKNNLVVTAIPV